MYIFVGRILKFILFDWRYVIYVRINLSYFRHKAAAYYSKIKYFVHVWGYNLLQRFILPFTYHYMLSCLYKIFNAINRLSSLVEEISNVKSNFCFINQITFECCTTYENFELIVLWIRKKWWVVLTEIIKNFILQIVQLQD